MHILFSLRRSLAVAALLALAACDRAATEPRVGGRAVGEIVLEDAAGNVIFSHRDHWHGAPSLRVGEALPLQVYFVEGQAAPDEHEAPPREQWFSLADVPEYGLRATIEHPALARWEGDASGGTLVGVAAGASRISYVVARGGATIYEAPPLNFVVRAP